MLLSLDLQYTHGQRGAVRQTEANIMNNITTETVKPNDLMVGDTIFLGGETYTVGKDTVKTGFCGTAVRGLRMKTVERVLYKKFRGGEFIGFVSQP
jgi:hypothetical protein